MRALHGTSAAESAAEKIITGSLMTVQEVAAKLDVSRVTVIKLCLPSIRIGRARRYDPKDVAALIDKNKDQA